MASSCSRGTTAQPSRYVTTADGLDILLTSITAISRILSLIEICHFVVDFELLYFRLVRAHLEMS